MRPWQQQLMPEGGLLMADPPKTYGNQLDHRTHDLPLHSFAYCAFVKRMSPPNLKEWEPFVQVNVSEYVHRQSLLPHVAGACSRPP